MEATTEKFSEILSIGDIIYVKYISNSFNGLKVTKSISNYLSKKSVPYLQFELFQKPEVQASSITIDPITGEVYSMVGGNKYFPSYFNRAVQSKRQPGSH